VMEEHIPFAPWHMPEAAAPSWRRELAEMRYDFEERAAWNEVLFFVELHNMTTTARTEFAESRLCDSVFLM